MKIIDKIKCYGILTSIKKIPSFALHMVIKCYSDIVFKWYRGIPIDEHSIVLESEGDCCDNAYALFDYLQKNGYLEKYKITWLVSHPKNFKDEMEIKYVQKNVWRFFTKETIKELSTCRWYIYDHCDLLENKKRDGQKSYFLTHGAGFKTASIDAKTCYADVIYTVSPFFYKRVADWCGCNVESMKDLGFPRLDYFFNELSEAQIKFQKKYKLETYKKIFLWMPTFRTTGNIYLNEDYFSSETGLPILYKKKELEDFNETLRINNSMCFFKVHHLQADLDAFKEKYSNIVILTDEDLQLSNLQLYQFIRLTSCLITDYSSISTDYMLLDRPIIYTMDDYEEYKNSRGFSVEDPAQYFAGYHVYDKNQLTQAIQEVASGADVYKEEREKVLPLFHSHIDGNSSARIVDDIGL